LGRCKQKQRGLRGLLCHWPSITEWEMYITAQGPVSEMTYTVSSGTLNSSIPYHTGTYPLQLGRCVGPHRMGLFPDFHQHTNVGCFVSNRLAWLPIDIGDAAATGWAAWQKPAFSYSSHHTRFDYCYL